MIGCPERIHQKQVSQPLVIMIYAKRCGALGGRRYVLFLEFLDGERGTSLWQRLLAP
jgi:hypothetical protein